MGTSSKAKTNKTGVAKKPRVVLGGARSNSKGTASSARSTAKTFTKVRTSKAKAAAKVKAKGKGKIQAEVKVQNVAQPDYCPKAMLSFCGQHLDSLEMDILKRLVRLYQKDTAGDVKKLLHVLEYYFPKDRTTEEVFDLVSDWSVLAAVHDIRDSDVDWDTYYKTRIPYIAHKFIRAVCLQSQDKLDLIQYELKELGKQFV